MIYFIHIPKTAGSTFDEILSKQYGKQHILDLNNVEIDMEFKNDTHKPKIESQLSKKEEVIAATGHFRYGLHNMIDQHQPARYVAFFRNPKDQFLSQYYYCLNLEAYPDIKKSFEATGNLQGFLDSDLMYYSVNMQTYFLTDTPGRKEFMEKQEAMLEEAVNHVESSFLFCGLAERFDESLVVLKELLGWKKLPLYRKKKVNKYRDQHASNIDKLDKSIRDINAYDFALYEKVYSKFMASKSKVKHLKLKVFVFRLINKIHQLF
ncbi:MAG: sulfotransferase family 2 domain-containing protein [Bacteroidota bacterium]